MASTPQRCTHCGLAIWERTRKQAFHAECKYLWDEAKLKIYKANQLIWVIRKQGYYDLDGAQHGTAGMTDEAILDAIGQGLPVGIVYENLQSGGFRFVKVEFRGDYLWRPEVKRRTVSKRIAKYEALKTPSKPLLEKELFVQVKRAQRQELRAEQRQRKIGGRNRLGVGRS